jgi:flagellar hook-length control protein FliK
MMTIAPIAALPQLSAQNPQAEGASPDAAAPGRSFAQLLEQRRGQTATAPHAAQAASQSAHDTRPASQSPAEDKAAKPEQGQAVDHAADHATARGQRPAGAARESGKARDAASRAASARADAKAETERKAAAAANGKTATAPDDQAAVDPALAAWLAGLQLPDTSAVALPTLPAAPTPAAAPTATAAATVDSTAGQAVGSEANAALAAIAGGSQAACGSGGTGDGARPAAPSITVAAAEPTAAGMSHGSNAPQPAGDTSSDEAGQDDGGQPGAAAHTGETLKSAADKLAASFTLPAASQAVAPPTGSAAAEAAQAAQAVQAATGAQATAATAPGRDAGRPLPVALDTPVTSPEFPQAIGVRIGMLARDGIEHAELQLNPAEMGPVSVRIVVDGAQARIDFGADVAATRQAIESSLPELASALRDAGLTLTGGGVSQHAHSQRDGQPAGPGTTARGGTRGEPGQPGDNPAPAQRRTVRAGGVDLYA